MLILNIAIYPQDNRLIKLVFKQEFIKEDKDRLIPYPPIVHLNQIYKNQTLQEIMVNKFNYPKLLILHREILENGKTSTKVIYDLPHNTQIALDFVSAIHNFIFANEFDKVIVNSDEIIDMQNEKIQSPADVIIKQILNVVSIPEYGNTLDALEKLREWKSENPDSEMQEALAIKNRFGILSGLSLDKTLLRDGKVSAQEKQQYLLNLINLLFSEKYKTDLNHLLGSLDREGKIAFYADYINRSEEQASWNDPEWKFLREAQFDLREDGRVRIDVKNNTAYQEFFASGKQYHDEMEERFENMTQDSELSFDDTTDFHNEIVFTPEASEYLVSNGMHINRNYIDTLAKQKQGHSPFLFGTKPDQALSSEDLKILQALFDLSDWDIEQSHLLDVPAKLEAMESKERYAL